MWRWRPQVRSEWLIVGVCLYLALMFNDSFWRAVLAERSLGTFATWRLLLATFVALCALHFVALACLSHRWTIKPVLIVSLLASAMAGYYMDHYAVFMDTDMLRNVLHTEYKEGRELVTAGFVGHVLLWTIVPILVLARVTIQRQSWLRGVSVRVLSMLAATVLVAGGLAVGYRDLSALMRNQKEVRYLVTPGNLIYSTLHVALADARQARQPIRPLGVDARVAPRLTSHKPRLLIIIVGETVRARNWGLNGYQRDTTPQLRALKVVNFSDVQACGSATEVSLPCMFAAVGRRNYDESAIRSQESLLHVLNHAGVRTLWRDNQTGCKGVCAGLPFQQWNDAEVDGLCRNGLCFDDILLHDLQKDIDAASGDLVVVLHPLGNHGPNYYLRYPEEFRRYTPTCDSAELGECSSEQIVNSYDNAVLYADHFVSETIRLLERQTTRDSALIYVSDHGESLGEQGIFLHGIPYAIAPDVQTAVPMVTWLSPGLIDSAVVDVACLRRESAMPFSHDNLFHSTLGLLDVQTRVYEPALDLFRSCRSLPNQPALRVALD